jgi:hypothetical protein
MGGEVLISVGRFSHSTLRWLLTYSTKWRPITKCSRTLAGGTPATPPDTYIICKSSSGSTREHLLIAQLLSLAPNNSIHCSGIKSMVVKVVQLTSIHLFSSFSPFPPSASESRDIIQHHYIPSCKWIVAIPQYTEYQEPVSSTMYGACCR